MTLFRRIAGTALPYALCIVLAKGVSLGLVPWITAHLTPADYGRIEVAASIIEFTGLLFAFGLADTLFRFAGFADSEEQRRSRAASLAGAVLGIALICTVLLQVLADTILSILPIHIDAWAFRLSLLAASIGGTIELPLSWLRLRNRPFTYLGFWGARSFLQLGAIVWAVSIEPRAESVLAATAAVEILMSAALFATLVRDSGLRFSAEALHWIRSYTLPLMAGSLATFVVGTFDRWLLVGQVTTVDLGHYGIASKVSQATQLIMQPFSLWWYARRMSVLAEPDGLRRSADAIGMGFVVLIVGGVVACLAGPAFIRLALPASYLPAILLVPGLVAVSFLNETASLINVGCYARNSTVKVTIVNIAGAGVALAGYLVLIPRIGIEGAIVATQIAHLARIAGFLVLGHPQARIPYQIGPVVVLGLIAAAGVALTMRANDLPLQIAALLVLPIAVGGMAWVLGLIRLPRQSESAA